MTGRVEMFARMLVRARIAAPDVAARQADAQVRPRGLAQLVALLAFAWCERLRLDPGCSVGREVFANSAWERLGRDQEEIGDEVLRNVLRGLDLEEATLNRG